MESRVDLPRCHYMRFCFTQPYPFTLAAVRIGLDGPRSHHSVLVNIRAAGHQSDVKDSPLAIPAPDKFHVDAGRDCSAGSVTIFVATAAVQRALMK